MDYLTVPHDVNPEYLLKTLRHSHALYACNGAPHKIFPLMLPKAIGKKNHPQLSILRLCPGSLIDNSLVSLILYFHSHHPPSEGGKKHGQLLLGQITPTGSLS